MSKKRSVTIIGEDWIDNPPPEFWERSSPVEERLRSVLRTVAALRHELEKCKVTKCSREYGEKKRLEDRLSAVEGQLDRFRRDLDQCRSEKEQAWAFR
jgi:hypothetical protein